MAAARQRRDRVEQRFLPAAIEIVACPDRIAPGARVVISARVSNTSPNDWLQDLTNQINLGNHWLDADGQVVVNDDGCTSAFRDASRQEVAFEVELTVTAPDLPGQYLLALDLVQERITWFAAHGSAVARAAVAVEAPSKRPRLTPHLVTRLRPWDEPYPVFMMRAIPHENVERLITELGGELLYTHEHLTEWVSYHYVTPQGVVMECWAARSHRRSRYVVERCLRTNRADRVEE